MATIPVSDCDLIARHVSWVNDLNLGSKTYADDEVRTSNSIQVFANMLVDVIAGVLVGGTDAFTVDVYLTATAGVSGSPAFTLTLDGPTDANNQEGNAPVTDTHRFLTLVVTETGAGGTGGVLKYGEVELKDLCPLQTNGTRKSYHELKGAMNLVPSTPGTIGYVPYNYLLA